MKLLAQMSLNFTTKHPDLKYINDTHNFVNP